MRVRKKKMAFMIAMLMVVPLCVSCGKDKNNESAKEQEKENKEKSIGFPYELDDGKLIVNSLFQSSVENPDCNNELGEDIASLEIVNQSEEFCISAEIRVTMQDGKEIAFAVTNIPAGKKVWAFAVDNQSIEQENSCIKIESTAEFGKEPLLEDQIQYSVEDTTITIQNLTQNDITDLSVGCHCLFEDTYFGGFTYNYPVDVIPAEGKVNIEADECYMGTAEVVCMNSK